MLMYFNAPVVYEVSDHRVTFISGLSFTNNGNGYLRCVTGKYKGKYIQQIIGTLMGIILKSDETIDHKDTKTQIH